MKADVEIQACESFYHVMQNWLHKCFVQKHSTMSDSNTDPVTKEGETENKTETVNAPVTENGSNGEQKKGSY